MMGQVQCEIDLPPWFGISVGTTLVEGLGSGGKFSVWGIQNGREGCVLDASAS